MAKKKAARKFDQAKESIDDGRTRMAFRFDSEVAEELQKISDRVGVSVNRLMNAMAWFLVTKGRINLEPHVADGMVYEEAQQGVIWFGALRQYVETGRLDKQTGEPETTLVNNGFYLGKLDFTERRVVSDD